MIKELRANDERILIQLDAMASKEDIAELRSHIDTSINGLLRDALRATPEHTANQLARQSNVWLAVAGVATICTLIVAILAARHGF